MRELSGKMGENGLGEVSNTWRSEFHCVWAMAAVHLMRFLSRWIANDVPLSAVCDRMESERDVMYFPLSA